MADAEPNGFSMTEETLKHAMLFLQNARPNVLLISGGEPTLHPSFESICSSMVTAFPMAAICLLSNGSFIENKESTTSVERLIKHKAVSVSIRTHPDFYPNYEKTMSNKDKLLSIGCEFFNDGIGALTRLGRAKNNHLDYRSKAAQCANTVLTAKQTTCASQWISMLECSARNFCKPTIGVDGTIYPGETQFCMPIGHVRTSSISDVYERAKALNPLKCNKCNGLEAIKSKNRPAYDLLTNSQS